MIDSFYNAFKLGDLRKRLLFVLFAFTIFMFGLHITIPGIDREALSRIFGRGGILGLLNLFTGGAMERFSIFGMGIMPYINASIIMSLLHVVIPQIEEMRKEGEVGRKIIAKYTRYLTVALALVQATGLLFWFRNMGVLHEVTPIEFLRIVVSLTAGTAFLMWLAEEITERGIGNGVSLIICVGIIGNFPASIAQTIALYNAGTIGLTNVLMLIAIGVVVVGGIVLVHFAERRIVVQYAKRVVGRKMYGGQATYLPIKVNSAGVIPIIFAVSVTLFPATVAQFIPYPTVQLWVSRFTDSVYYNILYALLVIFFTYFYTAVVFNPTEIAENIKKYGGFVPGIRPGKPTAEYLDRILTRVTLIGAIFLAIIAVLPTYVTQLTKVTTFYLGGTSLLIVVGVVLDTVQQLQAQLVMRHYEGFIK